MHPNRGLPNFIHRLLTREDGLTMSEVMWSLALVAMIVAIAYFVGPVIGADWANFVGDPTP